MRSYPGALAVLMTALLIPGPASAARESLRLGDARPLSCAAELEVDPARDHLHGVEDLRLQLQGRRRSLVIDAVGMSFGDSTITAGGQTRPLRISPRDSQTVTLSWDGTASGEATLHLVYDAPVDAVDTSGAFVQREGDDAYLFTQFEPTDARRVFPGIDQPDFKIPWTLTLDLPAGLGAYANTPVASQTAGADGRKKVVFAETRPLPSYLVAFAVGPFDVVDAGTAGRNHVPVRIVVPRGRAADAAWAAEVTGPLLEDLEAYFDVDYPYEKLDIVSLPKPVGWGAMENAGLITMEQGWVIARAEDDALERRRDYAETAAHELAHQWFGDLVTPAWWDDLWLNESFASWLATRTLEARWPDWRMDVRRVAYQGEAMAADSLTTARQIHQPIRDDGDIDNAFDAITYNKGEAVLRMMERWLGPDTFRAGVTSYLRDHAYGTATADDFVSAVARAANSPVAPVFWSFLDQPGLPEIQATCEAGAQPELRLEQARWLPSGPAKGRWSVPVCLRQGASDAEIRSCTVLDRRVERVPLAGATCPDHLVLNDGQSGYYRVRYDDAGLGRALASDSGLSDVERVGVLQDASAAVSRGEVSPGVLLGQLPGLLAMNQRPITAATLSVAAALDGHLVPDDLRPAYQRFLRQTYGSLASELGFVPAGDEDEQTRLLRPEVLSLVGVLGRDPELARQAAPLGEQWLSERHGPDPALVPVVLEILGLEGGLPWSERLRASVEAEPDRARREALFEVMGAQRDPEAIRATLDWVAGGKVDAREALPVFFGFLQHEDTARAQWAWAEQHFDQLEALIPSAARAYLSYLGMGFCAEDDITRFQTFMAPKATRWIGGRQKLAQVVESAQNCESNRVRQQEGVRAFLSTYAENPTAN